MISKYDYIELSEKALAADATDADLCNLGEWFNHFGEKYWNGVCYTIDASHDLYPIYRIDEDTEDSEIIGWEVR